MYKKKRLDHDTINAPSVTSECILKRWPKPKTFKGPSTRRHDDVSALGYAELDQVIMIAIWAGYAGIIYQPGTSLFRAMQS